LAAGMWEIKEVTNISVEIVWNTATDNQPPFNSSLCHHLMAWLQLHAITHPDLQSVCMSFSQGN